MNILFIGDIFGSAGRRIVREHIGYLREAHSVELIVINAENAAGGFGLTPLLAEEFFDLGADVLTTGNHVWDKRELIDYMESRARREPERGGCCGRRICSRAFPGGAFMKEPRKAARPTQ